MLPVKKYLIPIVGLVLLSLLLLVIQLVTNPSPVIDRIEPAVGQPGTFTRIHGKNLGHPQKFQLYVGEELVKPSDIVSWTDQLIEFHIPEMAVSSNLSLVMNSSPVVKKFWVNSKDLPIILGQNTLMGSSTARIFSISPSTAQISELITILGEGFGSGRGEVAFAWGPLVNKIGLEPSITTSDAEIEFWDDTQIKVRVPSGATSGTLRVITPKGFSNGIFFEINSQYGYQEFKNIRQYVLNRKLELELSPKTPSSRSFLVLDFLEDWKQRGISIGRMPSSDIGESRLSKGQLWWEVPRQFSGNITAEWEAIYVSIETTLQLRSELIPEITPFPEVAPYLASDDEISWNNEFVRKLSLNVGGWPSPGRGPLERVRGLFYWFAQNFQWNNYSSENILDVLRMGRGSQLQGCKALVGLLRASRVPARWVKGFLVLSNLQLIPHWWIEFYLPGLGWLSADPYLASGNAPEGFILPVNPLEYYLGNLDNRRIVQEKQGISKSSIETTPLGNQTLEQDKLIWHSVEVTGFY